MFVPHRKQTYHASFSNVSILTVQAARSQTHQYTATTPQGVTTKKKVHFLLSTVKTSVTKFSSTQAVNNFTYSFGRLSDWLRAGRPTGWCSSASRFKKFPSSVWSREALEPTQPPIQWVEEELFPEVTATEAQKWPHL
jgi:hypothetical protein